MQIISRSLFVLRTTLRRIEENILGLRSSNYREEVMNGNYVTAFKTEKGLAFSSLKSEFELMLPTTVEESEWLV